MNKSLTTAIDTRGLSSANQAARNSLVRVEDDEGRLRLWFSYAGNLDAMAVGLPNSSVNRIVVQCKDSQIELDIISGNFDATLKQYKPPTNGKAATSNQVAVPFGRFRFTQARVKGLDLGSLCRYDCALKHWQKFFKGKNAENVNGLDAQLCVEYLRAKVPARTLKDFGSGLLGLV